MEFTIDFALVRKITTQEGIEARTEINELGPLRAYQRSIERHDQRLAQAPDAPSLACQAGCSWCCHFSVDVRPVEVLNILEFVAQRFNPLEREKLRTEIAANSAELAQLDELQRMRRNLRCPFLLDGRCSIYAARPQTCRNYHATNAAGCRKSFEEPDNDDIAPEYAPLVYQAGAAHVEAFSKALADAGYDVSAYELNSALAIALAQPDSVRQSFEARRAPLAGLEGREAPCEFIDE